MANTRVSSPENNARVNLLIDGRRVSAPADFTILQAARSVGIDIPHLCYEDRLTPSSACRLCVVEVEGLPRLACSCSHPVAENMVVKTNSPRVTTARQTILELIVSNHPLDCMTCEKSGDCLLEKYAYQLGVKSTRFSGDPVTVAPILDNPFIVRDASKCILCARCVTVCTEIQQCEVLGLANRGFDTTLGTAFDKPITSTECVLCGNCVSVCPVGALSERPRSGKGRQWEFKTTKTICPYCGCGCELLLHTKDNQIVSVSSPTDSPVNNGWLCVKGRFGLDFVNSPDRLTKPLVKKAGQLQEATWEEALARVVQELQGTAARYGPDAIAGFSSAKCTNEENYLFQKLLRASVGTNNVDHCARLCHSSTVAGLAKAFGSGAMTNSIGELSNAHCILVIGSNTTETHPIVALQIKQAVRNGAFLIVADPRRIELTRFAHLWLRHNPGSDVALINGMIHHIFSEKLHNEDFISTRTNGFDALRASIEHYQLEQVAKMTGVPALDIGKAARAYAQQGPSSIVYAMGITQHTTGTDNVLALANLALVCGMVGRESTGVNPLRGQNNVQGACDMGALPNVLPGYRPVANDEARMRFEATWGVKLPSKPGLTVLEVIHAIEQDRVHALYVMGENPVLSDPNSNRTRAALAQVDFLVVQDIFLSETAKLADVVLPSCCSVEKDGTFTNTERRIQLLRRALMPPGEAKPDWQILTRLSTMLGYPLKYTHPSQIMDEIAALTPLYGGVTYARLESSGLQWPCPDSTHPGTPFLHHNTFTRGRAQFHPTEYIAPAELPDKQYPLLLTTGRLLYHFHTGTMTRRVEGINVLCPAGLVEINPIDAEKLALRENDRVRVQSRRGNVVASCQITENSPPGVVFMTFHFAEAAANILTNDAVDPIAGIPELKVAAVHITRV